MAQLMPLPLTVSCFSKIHIGFIYWYRLTWLVLDKGPLNGCACVLYATFYSFMLLFSRQWIKVVKFVAFRGKMQEIAGEVTTNPSMAMKVAKHLQR